jgi:hypothetical protein
MEFSSKSWTIRNLHRFFTFLLLLFGQLENISTFILTWNIEYHLRFLSLSKIADGCPFIGEYFIRSWVIQNWFEILIKNLYDRLFLVEKNLMKFILMTCSQEIFLVLSHMKICGLSHFHIWQGLKIYLSSQRYCWNLHIKIWFQSKFGIFIISLGVWIHLKVWKDKFGVNWTYWSLPLS